MSITGKIYRRITDFLGNKIINAKTNTPVNEEDIVNKKYVDDNIVFDTIDSENNSTRLPWVTRPKGKSLKEVINDILYKQVTTYVNPQIDYLRLKLLDNLSGGNEDIINCGNTQTFLIELTFTYTNRQSNINPKLIFVKNNGSREVFELVYNDKTSRYNLKFNYDFLSVKDVLIERVYESLNDPNAPDEFNQILFFSESIFTYINNKFLIFEPIYSLKIDDNDLKELKTLSTLDEKLQKLEEYILPKLGQFQIGNKIDLDINSLNKYGFIFVSNNIIESNLEMFLKSKTTGHLLQRYSYSYDDFNIKAFKTVFNLAPLMGSFSNLLYTDISKISSFVFVYLEFGKVQEESDIFITYDKIYYK